MLAEFDRLVFSTISGISDYSQKDFRDLLAPYNPSQTSPDELTQSIVENLASSFASDVGRLFSWKFLLEEELLKFLQDLINPEFKPVEAFTAFNQCTKPYPECDGRCESPCIYRPFVWRELSRNGDLAQSQNQKFSNAIQEAVHFSSRLASNSKTHHWGLATCYLIQYLSGTQIAPFSVKNLFHELYENLANQNAGRK